MIEDVAEADSGAAPPERGSRQMLALRAVLAQALHFHAVHVVALFVD